MAMFGHCNCLSASLSCVVDAAKPCARFVQESRERVVVAAALARVRARYDARDARLRSRMRSVTS